MPSFQKKNLVEWYLARLRSLAINQAGSKLTPRALVYSDSELIRDIVIKSGAVRDHRTAQLVQAMDDSKRSAGFFKHIVVVTAVIGIFAFLILLFA